MNSVRSQRLSVLASPGNYIIHEESVDYLDHMGTIKVNSNVPVTIQHFSDDEFMFDQQPLGENEAKVLVTSNCKSSNFIPQVSWDAESIDVHVQDVQASDMLFFINSSSYHAEWSYEIPGCRNTVALESEVLPARRRLHEGSARPLKPAFQATLHHVMDALGRLTSSNACNFNVEVMLDGFSHDVDVTAPSVRVVESEIGNMDYVHNLQNECVVDVKSDIMFIERARPTRPPTMKPTLTPTFPPYNYGTFPPASAVPGRPFVDSLGNTLTAASTLNVPNIAREDKSWSTAVKTKQPFSALVPSSDNSTALHANQLRLSEAWTKSALGEHASVASFSAFAISLMTNQAPSDLVEAALTAALDEVRHARTSFDIVSRLSGVEVTPGALPESKLVFVQDLKALAMAVAKEGCVDETLSALEAAAEVEAISMVLADVGVNDSKYYRVDRDILAWIQDELRIIASEESRHAALAWRTFQWVCTIDSDACDAVKDTVLNEDELNEAFHSRFESIHIESAILNSMKESWRIIHSHGMEVCPNQHGSTKNNDVRSLVSELAYLIVQSKSCM